MIQPFLWFLCAFARVYCVYCISLKQAFALVASWQRCYPSLPSCFQQRVVASISRSGVVEGRFLMITWCKVWNGLKKNQTSAMVKFWSSLCSVEWLGTIQQTDSRIYQVYVFQVRCVSWQSNIDGIEHCRGLHTLLSVRPTGALFAVIISCLLPQMQWISCFYAMWIQCDGAIGHVWIVARMGTIRNDSIS